MTLEDDIAFLDRIPTLHLLGKEALRLLAISVETIKLARGDILFEEGLLNKNRSEIHIERIRTIKIKQSFFNRIFGTGTIELYTAGDTPEIVAVGMPDPHRVRDLIKNRKPGVD